MDLLVAGILLWSGVHYIPGFMPGLKKSLVEKFGNGYRGLFTLLIVLSLVMIVFGWRSSEIEIIYDPVPSALQLTSVLMLISLYLFGAAQGASNIKRFIRHPMLTAVIVWGVAHLLSNGDSRSIILFGGMIIWAISEILIINKREDAYDAPGAVPMKNDVKKIIIACVVYAVLVFGHPYFTGMPVMGAM
ncbi:NnrU family protein [Pseudemcibacter sp.]|uniref:NnrU family protein n=1 Tax=Pseudemcibacter sp. TaxID=2943293 RepID=UPI003F6987EC